MIMKTTQKRFLKLLIFSILFTFFAFSLYGCSENPSDINDENKDPRTPRTSVPQQLVASWTTGTISSINFFNTNTGAWSAPSGVGIFYKLTQDGYYEKGVLLQSSLYGCTTTFYAFNKGTVNLEANKIVLYPTYGKIKSEDNCVQDNNYEKADNLATETIYWELGVDEFGNEVLWLRYENGSPSAFYRN